MDLSPREARAVLRLVDTSENLFRHAGVRKREGDAVDSASHLLVRFTKQATMGHRAPPEAYGYAFLPSAPIVHPPPSPPISVPLSSTLLSAPPKGLLRAVPSIAEMTPQTSLGPVSPPDTSTIMPDATKIKEYEQIFPIIAQTPKSIPKEAVLIATGRWIREKGEVSPLTMLHDIVGASTWDADLAKKVDQTQNPIYWQRWVEWGQTLSFAV